MVRLAGRGPFLTGPGGVPVGADDGGVDRDGPVQVAFRIVLAGRAVKAFSRVPSAAHFLSRLWAPATTRSARAGPSMASRCGT